MPQFDYFSYSSEIFWTLFIFCSLYFLVLRIIARVGECLKLRKKTKEQVLSVSTELKNLKKTHKTYDSFIILLFKTFEKKNEKK